MYVRVIVCILYRLLTVLPGSEDIFFVDSSCLSISGQGLYSGSVHSSLWPSYHVIPISGQQAHFVHTTAASFKEDSDSPPAHYIQDQFSHMKYWEHDGGVGQEGAQQECDGNITNTVNVVDHSSVYWNQFVEQSKKHNSEIQNHTSDSLNKAREVANDTSVQTLSHVNIAGEAQMVDISGKTPTVRQAVAKAEVSLGSKAFALVRENKMKKGDVLGVARVAGIMAAKRTWELIPLCHPLPIDSVDMSLELQEKSEDGHECHKVVITAQAVTTGRSGVEMEALTAASVAALTVYDMCKGVTHDITITGICLISKTGGKRDFARL